MLVLLFVLCFQRQPFKFLLGGKNRTCISGMRTFRIEVPEIDPEIHANSRRKLQGGGCGVGGGGGLIVVAKWKETEMYTHESAIQL